MISPPSTDLKDHEAPAQADAPVVEGSAAEEDPPAAAPAPGADARGRWSAIIGLGGVAVSAVAVLAAIQLIGGDRLHELVQAAGPLGPLAYIVLKASSVVVTPISGTPLRFAAGALFGFWEGVALSVAGSVLGGSINFWIARRFGRRIVARLLGAGGMAHIDPFLNRLADWRALIVARLVLAPLWDVLCYGAGLTRLRFRTFVAVAAVGDLLPTMLLVGVGSSFAELDLLQVAQVAAEGLDATGMVPLVGVLLGVGLLLCAAALLRPRVLRLLARPAPRRQPADA